MQQLYKFIIDGFTSPGSFAMWGVLLLGFAILGFVVERVWYLYFKCGGTSFLAGIQKYVKAGDFDRAIKLAKSVGSPMAKSIMVVLKNRGQSSKVVQKRVDEVFLSEAPKISRNVSFISTLANLSTMLGLTGTIFGLMMAFDAIANVPAAQRGQALATGISVAMSTTLFGLLMAIPGILAQGILAGRSDKVLEDLDEKTTKFINLLEE